MVTAMQTAEAKIVPKIIHPHGYRCDIDHTERYLWIIPKVIYTFRLDPKAPLTYHHSRGAYLQPDKHFKTDKASVPMFAQLLMLLPRDVIEVPALFHDSVYLHGGIWQSANADGPYRFVKQTRQQADELLAEIITVVEGVCPVQRGLIWSFVRMAGWVAWRSRSKGVTIKRASAGPNPMPTAIR